LRQHAGDESPVGGHEGDFTFDLTTKDTKAVQ
jgi:hypothetical protein